MSTARAAIRVAVALRAMPRRRAVCSARTVRDPRRRAIVSDGRHLDDPGHSGVIRLTVGEWAADESHASCRSAPANAKPWPGGGGDDRGVARRFLRFGVDEDERDRALACDRGRGTRAGEPGARSRWMVRLACELPFGLKHVGARRRGKSGCMPSGRAIGSPAVSRGGSSGRRPQKLWFSRPARRRGLKPTAPPVKPASGLTTGDDIEQAARRPSLHRAVGFSPRRRAGLENQSF